MDTAVGEITGHLLYQQQNKTTQTCITSRRLLLYPPFSKVILGALCNLLVQLLCLFIFNTLNNQSTQSL